MGKGNGHDKRDTIPGTSAEIRATGLSGFAITHPHLVIVACLMILILGLLSLTLLPKDLLPASNMPAVQILSFYPGMPVDHVEKNLTARFERYTGQAIGLERQESRSLVGVSVVKNYFNSNTDLNTAITQTTSLVMSVLRKLPPGTQPPLILPFDPMASVPLALVAVSGDFPESKLYDTARYEVRSAIQSSPGAIAPTVMGGSERQVIVYLDPHKLSNFNFSPLDVIDRLTRLNTFIPGGNVKVDQYDYQISSNGLVDRIEEMNDFPLRLENGVPVYVHDVGKAMDASKVQTNIVMVNGKRQVYVPVYRQPGANSIQVVDDVRTAMQKLEKRLSNFKLTVVADQSSFIRKAIESITEEALIGGGLAALMVLLFLGNPRATVGILLSLPLSLLCGFIGFQATGQSINAMTLGGLALSIGVLVDNSIVVLENICTKIAAGMAPFEAALTGAAEVAMPVFASTLATLVVFLPVVFLTGIVKVLFSALAKAVIFAMLGSYITSMTVVPLFGAYLLKGAVTVDQLPFPLRLAARFIERVTKLYGRTLVFALAHRGALLALLIPFLAAGVILSKQIGTELFPRADSGNFVLSARQSSGIRVEKTEEFSRQVESKIREWIPNDDLKMIIANAGVYYGFPAAFTPNSGPQDVFFNIELTADRHHTSQYYAKIVRERLRTEFPGVELGIELGGLLTSAMNGGLKAPIDVQVQGPKIEKAHEIAAALAGRFKELSGTVDVRVQQRLDAPQIELHVDRHKAAEHGLTVEEVVKNVVSSVSGSSTFNSALWVDPATGIDYMLGVQMPEAAVSSFEKISQLPMTGRNQSRSVPLKLLADIKTGKGPSEINHLNLRPVVDIYLDAQGRDVGGLSKDVQKVIQQSQLPSGYSATVRGEISEMDNAVRTLGGGFFLAAALVYLILVAQFRSFLLAGIIMATVPLGMVGIVLMLVITNTYFSIQAAIGAIFMIGIAVANGVLLLEFILHKLEEGWSLDASIVEAAKARLRPIMMTSAASMLGLVPMAVGFGHGAEANIPLGRAVIGGQLVSTVLTLFVVPALFRILYARRHFRELKQNRERENGHESFLDERFEKQENAVSV